MMKQLLFFLLFLTSLQADLYDRNKYDLDFRPQSQPHYEQEHIKPAHHPTHPNCPCDPDDPECPCEIGPHGDYHRVD